MDAASVADQPPGGEVNQLTVPKPVGKGRGTVSNVTKSHC